MTGVPSILYDFRFIQKFSMTASPIMLSDWLIIQTYSSQNSLE